MNEINKVTILLADDDKDHRDLVKAALKDNCDIVAEAENGKEAIDLFRKHKPDVLILDIYMPVMDGMTALKVIKSEFPGAFVIMLTAVSGMNEVKECLKIGAANYLRKDISYQEMKKSFEESCRQFIKERNKGENGA